jgi:outer membrane protein insertion porin family/translocation and assembly module TamA
MERDFWDSRIHVGGYFNAQVDQPLKLQLPGMEIIPQSDYGYHRLAVPYGQASFALDLRRGPDGKRDPINPHSGFYFSNDLQFAYGPADWSSQDVRFRVEGRGYIPIGKKVTLALRLGGGILHAFGGGLADTPTAPEVAQQTSTRDPTKYKNDYQNMCPPQKSTGTRSRWIQLMQLRGFNSGGTNSNRGYAYSAVGPQEIVPGISPLTSDVVSLPNGLLQRFCTPLPTATGGMAMWEASIELRFPVYEKLGLTLFLDGSDVRQAAADFGAPFAPHLTVGIGVHYATPVGPLRADFGVRIPGAQVIGSACPMYDAGKAPAVTGSNTCDPAAHRDVAGGYLDPKYGQAGSVLGIPLALSLAIGEAF